jgi:TonB family protein
MTVIFWFNPVVYWYKKQILEIHEYLADAAVTKHNSIKIYGYLLMRQALPHINLSLSNQFNHSQLKKRIKMMTKKQSSKWALAKYALLLPLAIFMFLAFAAFNYPKTAGEVDEMPRFPGCENLTNVTERSNCAMGQLMIYVGNNLVYPETARKNKVEGMVVVGFTVKADGKIDNITVKKGIGSGCDEAAVAVFEKMKQEVTWVAGKKNGEAVAVEMALPMKFKLD